MALPPAVTQMFLGAPGAFHPARVSVGGIYQAAAMHPAFRPLPGFPVVGGAQRLHPVFHLVHSFIHRGRLHWEKSPPRLRLVTISPILVQGRGLVHGQ